MKNYSDAIVFLREILKEVSCNTRLSKKRKALIKKMEYSFEDVAKKLKECESQEGDKIGLTYVEGELINALGKGYIILFDNINSAKPETTEIFNPLLEANPTLNVYQENNGTCAQTEMMMLPL